jgi:hypothetical protein
MVLIPSRRIGFDGDTLDLDQQGGRLQRDSDG